MSHKNIDQQCTVLYVLHSAGFTVMMFYLYSKFITIMYKIIMKMQHCESLV